jgi:surface protein
LNPDYDGKYNFQINWNASDSRSVFEEANIVANSITHEYTEAGEKEVWITGYFPAIYNNPEQTNTQLIDVLQWGAIEWKSMKNAFCNCVNLKEITASDVPDLLEVYDFGSVFENCVNFNGNISKWDVSKVNDMSRAFAYCISFNQDLSSWKTGNVTSTKLMFLYCNKFNSDLRAWDTSNITDMSGMFANCRLLESNLGDWDVSRVVDMSGMFSGCENFTSDLSDWDVSKVTNLKYMFANCRKFNSDLSKWDVGNVKNMQSVFYKCDVFNCNLNSWDVSKVQNTSYMFAGAKDFDSELNKWNTKKIISMIGMFHRTNKFNSNIENWDVSSVLYMKGVFDNSISFNQNISNWNFNRYVDVEDLIKCAYSFSSKNYDNLLIKLSQLNLSAVEFNSSSFYTLKSEAARQKLLDDKFDIHDYGINEENFNCPPVVLDPLFFNINEFEVLHLRDIASVFFDEGGDEVLSVIFEGISGKGRLWIDDNDNDNFDDGERFLEEGTSTSNLREIAITDIDKLKYTCDNVSFNIINYKISDEYSASFESNSLNINVMRKDSPEIKVSEFYVAEKSIDLGEINVTGLFEYNVELLNRKDSFFIQDGKLYAKSDKVLDFEVETGIPLKLRVFVENKYSFLEVVLINIYNVNEFPILPEQSIKAEEGVEIIPEVFYFDPDIIGELNPLNNELSLSISGKSEVFEIVENKLQLKSGQSLDYEKKSEYSLNLLLTDGKLSTGEVEIKIELENINEAPSIITDEISVFENQVFISKLKYSDPETDECTFEIVGSSDVFYIVDDLLVGYSYEKFDYEKTSEYIIKVKAFDGALYSEEKEIRIEIENINESPVLLPQTLRVDENTNILPVVEFSDPDIIGELNPLNNELSLSISGESEIFEIVENKLQLKSGQNLDYEKQSEYILNLLLTDGKLSTGKVEITIEIGDVNEKPKILTRELNVQENSLIAGIIECDDPDGDNLNLILEQSSEIFYLEGSYLKLRNINSLDYEEQQFYIIRMRAYDGIVESEAVEVELNVIDVNEPVEVLTKELYSYSNKGKIGEIECRDPEDEEFSIVLTEGDEYFELSENILFWKEDVSMIRLNEFPIKLLILDGLNVPIYHSLKVIFVNTNSAPEIRTDEFIVEENTRIIGEVKYYDSESDKVNIRLAFESDIFELKGETIYVKLGSNIDYEQKQKYNLAIIANDGFIDSSPVNINIKLVDINDNPPIILTDTIILNSKLKNNDLIGVLKSYDADKDVDSQTYDWKIIEGNSNGALNLDSSTGELRISDYKYFYNSGNYLYKIKLSDGKYESDQKQIVLKCPQALMKFNHLNEVLLYPTVNEGKFTVFSYSKIIKSVEILSLNAMLIVSQQVNDSKADIKADLISGFYFVKINYDNTYVVYKMFVK